MAKITMTHDLDCDVETFWKCFFDVGFNDALYKGVLGFPDFGVVEQIDTAATTVRTVSGQPNMKVPAPLAKAFGTNFRYTEKGTLDKATNTWRWVMTPGALADKLRNEGTMRIEAVGEAKSRRTTDILVEASVFMVGGLIEEASMKQLREAWEKSAVFMNEWLRKGAFAKAPG